MQRKKKIITAGRKLETGVKEMKNTKELIGKKQYAPNWKMNVFKKNVSSEYLNRIELNVNVQGNQLLFYQNYDVEPSPLLNFT